MSHFSHKGQASHPRRGATLVTVSGIVTGMWDGSGIQSEGKKIFTYEGSYSSRYSSLQQHTQHNVRHGCSFPISGSGEKKNSGRKGRNSNV